MRRSLTLMLGRLWKCVEHSRFSKGYGLQFPHSLLHYNCLKRQYYNILVAKMVHHCIVWRLHLEIDGAVPKPIVCEQSEMASPRVALIGLNRRWRAPALRWLDQIADGFCDFLNLVLAWKIPAPEGSRGRVPSLHYRWSEQWCYGMSTLGNAMVTKLHGNDWGR